MLVSLTFLLVVLGSLFFFGETVSWRKVAGLIVIICGIQLVSRG
jgi:drug/metabolite transporter (DMT)-like permease